MPNSVPRYFVEKVTDIDADVNNGNVKLTYAVRSKNTNQDVVQLVIHINDLRRSFAEVWEELQKTFTGPQGGRQSSSPLTDLTEN